MTYNVFSGTLNPTQSNLVMDWKPNEELLIGTLFSVKFLL